MMNMQRIPIQMFVLWVVVTLTACERADPQDVVLYKGKPQRMNECHVLLNDVTDDRVRGKPRRSAFLQSQCGVPEKALQEKNWWGDTFEPPGFAIRVGDCMPLDDVYFCLEDVADGKSATFRATYVKPKHPLGNLQRLP
jgi:hypothetical protein